MEVPRNKQFLHGQPLFFFQLFFIHQVIQRVLHYLGGVVSVISKKNSAYYVADLIHSSAFQFTNFVDKPKFS